MGLGCENNRIHEFTPFLGEYSAGRVKFLNVQGVQDELEEGLDKISELVAYAQTFQRQAVPVSRLKVGLKCGGSDGFSGITANPLIGATSDLLVSNGATTFLTEVPEMFGAETILMNRANNATTYQKIVDLINDFKDYYARHNQVIYENPSPGNKDGGITTLEEKSLGAAYKAGSRSLQELVHYAEKPSKKGLVWMDTPGHDIEQLTGMIAGGAQMALFTSGRGTPTGSPIAPVIKIATNTPMFESMNDNMDINAGTIIDGTESIDEVGRRIFQEVHQVANGKWTKAEILKQHDFGIWRIGPTF